MVLWKIGVSKFGTITKEELSYRQASYLLVPLTRRSHNMKQKTLLLLAQNPLDFETYRNRANGWLMSQAPTDGNTERWSKPRAVCLTATMKVVV